MKEKKEISGVRKKIAGVMAYIYGGGILLALFAGALSFIGYLVAIIIGGETAAQICKVIYKSIYPILITFTSCVVLFGLVKMYVAGEKALFNKGRKKVKKTEEKVEKVVEETETPSQELTENQHADNVEENKKEEDGKNE